MFLANRQEKILAFWAINSDRTLGLGKILRSNFPINQIDLLQIMANEGVATKVTFRNLEGEIKNEVQLIWAKNISQKDTKYALQVILGKLKHAEKYEMGVIAVLKEQSIRGGAKILPLDILEPSVATPEGKIMKWKTIRNWCDNPNTSEWAKYDAISPKHFRNTEISVT